MTYIQNFKPVIIENIDYSYLKEIEQKIIEKKSLNSGEQSYFLDVISYLTRVKINPNLNNYDYSCDLAQSILYHYLNNLNCKLYPAMTQNIISKEITGHSFLCLKLLVENKEQLYLLDPTYIQFFKQEKCSKDNYFISKKYNNKVLLTPDPGYFIQEHQKNNAEFLLNHGYINLTEETAKMYGDSFLNTKQGREVSNLKYESLPGNFYLEAFRKGNEKLSKTEEELLQMGCLIETSLTKSNKRK